MDQPPRDSMGVLAHSGQSSAIDTYKPALNAKMLGTDFAQLAGSEGVNRALARLVAVYGDPWGQDHAAAKLMVDAWEAALGDLPVKTIDTAVTRWMKQFSKWPKPADIRKLAEMQVDERVSGVAETTGLHPRRLNPTDEMKEFAFRKSMLRLNATWAKFLDGIHPTAEHFFFARATMGEFAHELRNLTHFETDYIREHWGDRLAEMFGRPVWLGKFDERPSQRQATPQERYSAEEIERRTQVIADAKRKWGFDQKPSPEFEPQPQGPKSAAPDDGYVSPQLRAHAKKHRYYTGGEA